LLLHASSNHEITISIHIRFIIRRRTFCKESRWIISSSINQIEKRDKV
jgi:hypothetical protein